MQGFPLAQDAGKTKKEPAPAAPDAAGKGERLKELIKILESITDDDYDSAVAEAPKQKDAPAPQTVSRSEALKSSYETLAALEYHEAARAPPRKPPTNTLKPRRALPPRKKTGWAMNLLEWLGNAAINYALTGGETYVGRGIKSSKAAGLDRKVGHLQKELSAEGAPRRRPTPISSSARLTRSSPRPRSRRRPSRPASTPRRPGSSVWSCC